MDYNFVRQHAPQLAIRPPQGVSWVTPPANAAGITPDAMYDSRGNPLNWMQDEGGQRRYFVPDGESAYDGPPASSVAPAAPDARTSAAAPAAAPPTAAAPSSAPNSAALGTSANQPSDLLRGRFPTAGIDEEGGSGASAPVGTPPVARIHLPPDPRLALEDRVAAAAYRQRNMENNVADAAAMDHGAHQPHGGPTVADLFNRMGFDFSGIEQAMRSVGAPPKTANRRAPGKPVPRRPGEPADAPMRRTVDNVRHYTIDEVSAVPGRDLRGRTP